MALTEREVVANITVLADGQIQVRKDTIIERDGEFVSKSIHRHVVAPDCSAGDKANQHANVQAIMDTVHTPQVKSDYEAWKLAQEA